MEKSAISWVSQRLQTKQETEKDNQESDSDWLFTYGTSEANYLNGIFVPQMWNVYERNMDTRTNNNVESK